MIAFARQAGSHVTHSAAGVVLSGRRPTREPQIIYVVAEPEPSSGLGCLLPLIVIGFVLLVVLVVR